MIISPDSFLYIDGKYVWTSERCYWAWKQAEQKFLDELAKNSYTKVILLCGLPGAGKSTWSNANDKDNLLILDATLVRIRDRSRVKRWFRDWVGDRECVFLNTSFEKCVERNNTRSLDRKIGDDVMIRMRNDLVVPTKEEGFDKVCIVGNE